MRVEIKHSFLKDLKKCDKQLQNKVIELINLSEKIDNIWNLPDIKKMKGFDIFYRIRIGDYRVGLVFENQTIYFVRFLNRRDIYKFFP